MSSVPKPPRGSSQQPSIFRTNEPARKESHITTTAVSALPNIIREGRMVIGPDLAAWILKDAAFEGQRKSERHHVELLAHLMREGRWSGGSQLAFCEFEGNLYQTNGKHRMNAIVVSGLAQEFQILITHCNSMQEVEADYHRHDTVARKRSSIEIMQSTELGRDSTLPHRLARTLYSLAPLLDRGLVSTNYRTDPLSRDVDALLASFSRWVGEAQTFAGMVAKSHKVAVRQGLFSPAITAVALLTIRHQPVIAEKFWPVAAEDDGLKIGDPRKALIDHIAYGEKSKDPSVLRFIQPALAWNAFFESRTLKIFKPSACSVLKIVGTPVSIEIAKQAKSK